MTARSRPRGHLLTTRARRTLGEIILALAALVVVIALQAAFGDQGFLP